MYKRTTTASRRKEQRSHERWLHVSVVENIRQNGTIERQIVSGVYKTRKPKIGKAAYKAAKRARPRPPKAVKKEKTSVAA